MRLPLLLFLLLDAAALVVFNVVAIVVLVVSIDITSTVILLKCISSTIFVRHFCIGLETSGLINSDFDIVINTSTLDIVGWNHSE